MKKQNSKINKTKLITRVIISFLLMAKMLSLTSCMWGPTIAYNWKVETHNEFVKEIEKYNSIHDEFINTFISFDLDNNENISNRMYRFSTIANKSAVHKYGLCDKVGRTFNVEFACHLRLNVENNDYPYQIGCYYRDTQYNFSEKDKIEIKKGNPYDGKDLSSQCNHMSKDRKYTEKIFSDLYIYITSFIITNYLSTIQNLRVFTFQVLKK